MKEANQQQAQQAQQQVAAIQQIGNYAMYHNQLGHNAAEFMVGDIVQLARAAMQTSELEEALRLAAEREDKIRKDWSSEVDGLVKEVDEANIRVNEMKNDVTNAEAHSEELNKKLKDADNAKEAAVFWYDAFKDVHMAIGGNDAVNVLGADDHGFVEKVIEAVKEAVIHANSKSDDSHKMFNAELLKAIGIPGDAHQSAAIEIAETMKRKIEASEHQEHYQKKYNELKNALGLAGIPHGVAVERAKKYTPDY